MLSLEGVPSIPKLNAMKIGKTILEIITNDQDAEMIGLLSYNAAINLANEISDKDSVDLLTKILRMKESHVDLAEIQQAQIEQMGLETYSAKQDDSALS
ncbi:MAG: ferritin-like domain-containing protein [Ignavibacteriaceae bacterium]|nr:ferritin-like domain-containing protein [Ignavibacteriaceae bacterium]